MKELIRNFKLQELKKQFMENKICTSLEQSKKLMELGIDVSTADMYWRSSSKRYYIEAMDDGDFNEKEDIPAWSLSALLGLIPNWTMDKTDKINLTCNPYYHCESCYSEPIDAAFEMVCWLLKENNE